jgi:AcrR family transcriptional regulator
VDNTDNSDRKLDRRIQRTQELLQQAMIELVTEKGYEAISIQEITDRANMARTTFYLHYADKDELLFSSVRDMVEELLSGMQPGSEGMPTSFEHIAHHAAFYRAILGEEGSPAFVSRLSDFVADVVRERMLSQMTAPGETPRLPLDFMTHYLVGAYVGVATWWLNNHMPYSAQEMAQLVNDLADKGLKWALGADEEMAKTRTSQNGA